jgi:hypothetical protein
MTGLLDNDSATLPDVIERMLDAHDEELHTAFVGRIESYDAAAQTADVQPLIRRRISTTDGGFRSEEMPTVRAVPVAWPRAGDWFLHMPLSAGDTVLVVVAERDFARWRVTGEASDPIDTRSHHLSHAIAVPGVYPRTKPLLDTPGNKLVLGAQFSGSDDPPFAPLTVRIGATDIKLGTELGAESFVALATLVDALFTAFLAATPASGDGGAALQTAVQTAWTTIGASVAASKVKAE